MGKKATIGKECGVEADTWRGVLVRSEHASVWVYLDLTVAPTFLISWVYGFPLRAMLEQIQKMQRDQKV